MIVNLVLNIIIGVLFVLICISISTAIVLFILWLLGKLGLLIYFVSCKKCPNSSKNTNSKFPPRQFSVYFIKCSKKIYYWLHGWELFRINFHFTPTRLRSDLRKKMKDNQCNHGDTKPQEYLVTKSSFTNPPSSHADTLPQEKEVINHKQTEPYFISFLRRILIIKFPRKARENDRHSNFSCACLRVDISAGSIRAMLKAFPWTSSLRLQHREFLLLAGPAYR